MSRVENLRDIVSAAVELKLAADGFCEPFQVRRSWFLAENYEEMFLADGTESGIVWLCSRPAEIQQMERSGGTAGVEEFKLHMCVVFPVCNEPESAISRHVQLVEELTDTIRSVVPQNGYIFISAIPAKDENGTPYVYMNMEERNFCTFIEFTFNRTLQ